MSRISKTVFVKAGKWRALETRWASAKIKARYGFGWLSKNRQKQPLDGNSGKRISIGTWGVNRVNVQIKTSNISNLDYDIEVIGP